MKTGERSGMTSAWRRHGRWHHSSLASKGKWLTKPRPKISQNHQPRVIFLPINRLTTFGSSAKKSCSIRERSPQMDNNNTQHNPPLFRERIVKASYTESSIPSYKGNPYIEALPPIWSKEDVISLLQRYPEYQEEHRVWPTELRVHLIRSVLKFFEVLPRHIDLEQRISCTIRTGYEARNPRLPDAWRQIRDKVESLKSALASQEGAEIEELLANFSLQPADPEMTATGFAFIGINGIGKTTSLKNILVLYPQVIIHSRYHDEDFH